MQQKSLLEKITVAVLLILTILLVELQFIYRLFQTPAGSVYLGTNHYPPDYFYYLSQLTQGRYHTFFSTMLFTAEKIPPTLVGWQTVLTGRIISLFGIDVISTYQVAVVVYLSFFLLLSYQLLREIFPGDRVKRLLAFVFFISSTSLVVFTKTANGFQWSYYVYWYNIGNVLERFSPVPHHLLTGIFATLGILLIVRWMKSHTVNIRVTAGFVIVGAVLSSITPVQWGVLVLSALLILLLWKKPLSLKKTSFPLYIVFPGLTLFISGLLPALYVKSVFSIPPYNLSSVWEASQQVYVSLAALLKGSGVVIVFACIGIWPYLKKLNAGKFAAVVFLSVSSFFYFSNIPQKLHLTNARFWVPYVYIFIAALASEGIVFLVKRFGKWRGFALAVCMVIYFISIVPTYFLQFRELSQDQRWNAFYYLPYDAYAVYLKAQEVSRKDDLFLVEWPFNESFPAITGRKSFFGFSLFTIDAARKEKEAFMFFDGKMTDVQAKKLMDSYKIDYILGYSWTPTIGTYPFLQSVYKNNTLTLYKVIDR